MTHIKRILEDEIRTRLTPGRVIMLFGARRTGKTFLMRHIISQFDGRTMFLNGEDYDTQAILENRTAANYRNLFRNTDIVAIDEAQNIPDIGAKLKLIVDELPDLHVIASGSSSLSLKNNAGEPLVGRSSNFILTPFSQQELSVDESPLETRQNIENRLVYGSYPDVVLMDDNKMRKEYLHEIVNAYLLKDILGIEGIKNASKIKDLLRLVAFQVGSEISSDELARQLAISKNTVVKYLDILSQVYVLYKIGGFSKNLRKEVVKASKWYFYDNGIRNAILNSFAPMSLREDGGKLWENYIIGERAKMNLNHRLYKELYFWRTYDQQEIDLIEVDDTAINAFEIKKGSKNPSCPKAFAENYPTASFEVINKDNYLEYIV